MKFKLLCSAAVALSLASVGTAQASDGTITFAGVINAQTCTINGNAPGTATNLTVNLPTVNKGALASAGATAGTTPFKLTLAGCAAGNARVFFENGPNVDATTGNIKNTGVTNVQIALLKADGSALNAATNDAPLVAIAGATAVDLNYFAQYKAVGGAAGSGTVNTSVAFTIAYN